MSVTLSATDVRTQTFIRFSGADIMFLTTRALFIPVVFLCALEETVLAHYGHCAADRCYAVFLTAADYWGAQNGCRDSGGRLLDREHAEEAFATVVRAIRGNFWLNNSNRSRGQACASISVTTEGRPVLTTGPGSDPLDGYLCQFAVEGPCGSLQARAGSRVSYVAHAGFEVRDSETFPQGTIATAETLGAEYADWKHVCFAGSWIKAPWACEVFNGGCEHRCDGAGNTCACPAGQSLHPNNVTCTKDPCAECAHECHKEGDSYVCACAAGYSLARDGKSCVDVDECKEKNPCTGENEECLNAPGGFACGCVDDFIKEDGVCVNVSICAMCEHMMCEKSGGVYGCRCRKGFRVSPRNPADCEQHCAEKDCPARCDPNTATDEKDLQRCFCPVGYIRDTTDTETLCTDIDECEHMEQCDHRCENSFGSFRCLCDEGHKLDSDDYTCLPTDKEEEELGSGASPSYPPPADSHQASVPFYIQTGSVMGIAVFVLLGAGLLYFLGRNMSKRCGRFELTSLKGADIDIFYLQQMSTDTYKRLSFDKQSKTDPQRV